MPRAKLVPKRPKTIDATPKGAAKIAPKRATFCRPDRLSNLTTP